MAGRPEVVMTKPTAYIETTVIGHLVSRILADPIVAGRHPCRDTLEAGRTNPRIKNDC